MRQLSSPRKRPLRSSHRGSGMRVMVHLLDWLWRFIGWLWGAIIFGMILTTVVGNNIYDYLTTGHFDTIDLAHLPLVRWIEGHVLPALLILFVLVAFSLAAFFAHKRRSTSDELAPLVYTYTLDLVKYLDPATFKLAHYIKDIYIERSADEQVHQILRDLAQRRDEEDQTKIGVCIVGRPAQGKTRLAWEAMRAELPDWTLVRWSHERTDLAKLISSIRSRQVVLWLDDLHEYANEANLLNDLPRRFRESGKHLLVIATCRDGENYVQVQKSLEKLLECLAVVQLQDIEEEEADELAEKLSAAGRGDNVHRKEFDGTPGSLLLGLARMQHRYLDLPKPAQSLLKAMKLLYSAQIYSYPRKRLCAVAHDLFDFCSDDWSEASQRLEKEDFVRIVADPDGERSLEQTADSYLDGDVIQDYPTSHASLESDWVPLMQCLMRERDGSELMSLGTAFHTRAGTPSQRDALLRNALQCFNTASEALAREKELEEWVAAQCWRGLVLSDLDRGEEAIKAYKAALGVWKKDDGPEEWAEMQNELGRLLSEQGRKEEALEAYNAALEVWTNEKYPKEWAGMQDSLGDVLSELGRNEEAKEAYEAAFTWANTQMSQAMTYQEAADHVAGSEALSSLVKAADCAERALTIFSVLEDPDMCTVVDDLQYEIERTIDRVIQEQCVIDNTKGSSL